jgi:uncharacterized protein GlcG (DUF336 family)
MDDPRFNHRPEVGLELALDLVRTVCAGAVQQAIAVCVAVTDRAGDVVACGRMDGAPLGAMQLALDKAYTAAAWQMPSGDLHVSTQPGGPDWGLTSTAGGRIVVYPGGLPIAVDGHLAGAIGVSGGTGEQDASCAAGALSALQLGEPAG